MATLATAAAGAVGAYIAATANNDIFAWLLFGSSLAVLFAGGAFAGGAIVGACLLGDMIVAAYAGLSSPTPAPFDEAWPASIVAVAFVQCAAVVVGRAFSRARGGSRRT